MLKSYLPEIYQLFLPESLLRLPLAETKATCQNCYKSQKQAPPPHYDAKLKCCTFYPHIPNFLVGGLLKEKNQHMQFKKTFAELIQKREYVLPIGICAPENYQYKFQKKEPTDYGNRADLLCPFYMWESGGCGVWQHRSHECATFFCVSNYGADGELFWSRMRDTLHLIEMTLSQEAMLAAGYSDQILEENLAYIRQDPDTLTLEHPQYLDSLKWSRLWAQHIADIESYFVFCHNYVLGNQKLLSQKVADNRHKYLDNDSVNLDSKMWAEKLKL